MSIRGRDRQIIERQMMRGNKYAGKFLMVSFNKKTWPALYVKCGVKKIIRNCFCIKAIEDNQVA